MIDKEDICAYLEEFVFYLKKFCKGVYNFFTSKKYFIQRLSAVTGFFIIYFCCNGKIFEEIGCNNIFINIIVTLLLSIVIGLLAQGILFFLADIFAKEKMTDIIEEVGKNEH